ncbi:hypothetical protein QAD02_022770 [Eretmocerus hayati]|uniref:Uncharacterized protein n=1 Tax=Eretmocerus hayati TaxID=131215 RepID=A0ACC2PTX0_9HYME|nr:hypothetical protein QAD02_022770 [Eretmocerus hayati]
MPLPRRSVAIELRRLVEAKQRERASLALAYTAERRAEFAFRHAPAPENVPRDADDELRERARYARATCSSALLLLLQLLYIYIFYEEGWGLRVVGEKEGEEENASVGDDSCSLLREYTGRAAAG